MITMVRNGLGRFRFAQDRQNTYRRALQEIRRGEKKTHWMWFIFPQHRGLAKSEIARIYGIADRAEADAYLADPILAVRLYECTTAILRQDRLMFSDTDTRKLRSCMTLFGAVAKDPSVPNQVLDKFFDGRPDHLTLDLLAGKKIVLPVSKPNPVTVRWQQPALRMPHDPEPWTRERVTSFVKSFGLSSVGTRQMVDAWMADRGRAMGAVWAAREQQEYEER